MRTIKQVEELLPELDHCAADDLEDQDLDFKRWDTRSMDKSVQLLIRMAVCMANGGGGTIVFGVADTDKGRPQAVLGVPPEVDIKRLNKAIYDQTDPKIMPVFEELRVPHGTGRLLIMQIHPGMPPYTDTSGRGTVRIGKECQPLTGTLRRKISVETGETDFTAETVASDATGLLSPTAMEVLRIIARAERAPEDLLRLSDMDLMQALGLAEKGRLSKASLLLGGSEEALRRHIPGYTWTFLRMNTDTDYANRDDHAWAIPQSIVRLEEHLLPFNPITTVQHGMFHFEYRTYPEIALREALMNAFCHADFRIAGPILVKLFDDRIEISNNGGFIGGITPENILHHQPAARNPLLVEAMTRLRLVNRSNLGISRMFQAFLIEAKPVPSIAEIGDSVRITMHRASITPEFRAFIAEQTGKGRLFTVNELLILNHLLRHPEVDTGTAAVLCQQKESDIRPIIASLEQDGLLERGGTGRGAYWAMRPDVQQRLSGAGHPERTRRIDWEAAKTRILSILMEKSRRKEPGLSSKDIRQITRYDRFQVVRIMTELRKAYSEVQSHGRGAGARYIWEGKNG
ncbi:MAG: ATP-binding protein [Kiritimatiellota bacterium]|nr:ATP-binding protein [Kiritimatiellota bacterium]